MRLMVEIEGEGEVALPGEGRALVGLMSFAVVRGFGAEHPLIALAERLAACGVRLGPLTTFYERAPEDAEDEANLERAWQPAAELRATADVLVRTLETDAQAGSLARRAGAETLAEEARALLVPLGKAEAAGRRVRLTYEL